MPEGRRTAAMISIRKVVCIIMVAECIIYYEELRLADIVSSNYWEEISSSYSYHTKSAQYFIFCD